MHNPDAYSEPNQTSENEILSKIVNGWLFLQKTSIFDAWLGSECASVNLLLQLVSKKGVQILFCVQYLQD